VCAACAACGGGGQHVACRGLRDALLVLRSAPLKVAANRHLVRGTSGDASFPVLLGAQEFRLILSCCTIYIVFRIFFCERSMALYLEVSGPGANIGEIILMEHSLNGIPFTMDSRCMEKLLHKILFHGTVFPSDETFVLQGHSLLHEYLFA